MDGPGRDSEKTNLTKTYKEKDFVTIIKMSHLLYEKLKLETWPEEDWALLGYLAQETLLLWVMGKN